MKEFNSEYFARFKFTPQQVIKNLNNAEKDLKIAKKDKILDVKFNYAYTAFIKSAIALLSFYNIKARSVPGHHRKIIEKLSLLLKDRAIGEIGNVMRNKRNLDLYSGGVEVTEKECREYIGFVEKVFLRVQKQIRLK